MKSALLAPGIDAWSWAIVMDPDMAGLVFIEISWELLKTRI
jgi:hypothetical protein